jgi:hypothetical protein
MTLPFANVPLRSVVWHLFNAELPTSEAILRAYMSETPGDPLAHALCAAVRFYDCLSTQLPSQDSESIMGVLLGGGVDMPAELRKQIGESLLKAQSLAQKNTLRNAYARNALLALCVTEMVHRDGLALVSQLWTASLTHARRAHLHARKLLEMDAQASDAYFVFACSEYIVSRVPAVARVFAQIPGVMGQRQDAIRFCEIAANSGYYFQDFARRMLATLYAEEGRHQDAVELLASLTSEFPGNVPLRAEWIRVRAQLARRA